MKNVKFTALIMYSLNEDNEIVNSIKPVVILRIINKEFEKSDP